MILQGSQGVIVSPSCMTDKCHTDLTLVYINADGGGFK